MGKHLLNLLAGARQALVMWPDADYIRPSKDGFQKDASKLRGDSKKVARGLAKTVRVHGKQANDR
ncbi:MAG: hypothetical protein ABI167_05380 [Nitrosospira sp.]